MALTGIDLNPPQFNILSAETLPITVEWQDLVGRGTIVSAPFGVLYDQSNGAVIPNAFLNNYGANGSQAQYIFQGPYLQRGHKYWAILSVSVGSQVYKQRLEVLVRG
jgi:hypothetical protein